MPGERGQRRQNGQKGRATCRETRGTRRRLRRAKYGIEGGLLATLSRRGVPNSSPLRPPALLPSLLGQAAHQSWSVNHAPGVLQMSSHSGNGRWVLSFHLRSTKRRRKRDLEAPPAGRSARRPAPPFF
jgi:hypothetical protein